MAVIFKDEFNWVMIDPRGNSLYHKILPYRVTEDVPAMFKKNYTVVEYRRSVLNSVLPQWGWVGCTSIVKYIIGIKNILIFTPYQLYKELVRIKHTL